MVRFLGAEDYRQALTHARQVLRFLRDDPHQRAVSLLLASATRTTLICAAELDPGDDRLPVRCDDIAEQFRESSFRLAGMTVISALGVKVQVLLATRRTSDAQAAARELCAFYEDRGTDRDTTMEAREAVRIASNMVAQGMAAPAAIIAGLAAERLAGLTGERERLLAARAEIWAVLAFVYAGGPLDRESISEDAEALWAALEADDESTGPAILAGVDRLIAMGDVAITAAETIAPKLTGPYWQVARMIIALLTIGVLDHLGRDQEAREYKLAFIKDHELQSDWPTETLVAWLRREVEDPQPGT